MERLGELRCRLAGCRPLTPGPLPPPALAWVQAKLEPPVRHLVCSQAGSNPNHYAALKDRVAALQQATAVLGRGQAACLQALASPAGGDITAPAAAQLRAALVQATALAAAACAGAAEALGHMPALGPCSGAALPWRPLTRGAWAEVRQALTRAAQGLAAGYEEAFKQHGLAFGLSLGIQEVGGPRQAAGRAD